MSSEIKRAIETAPNVLPPAIAEQLRADLRTVEPHLKKPLPQWVREHWDTVAAEILAMPDSSQTAALYAALRTTFDALAVIDMKCGRHGNNSGSLEPRCKSCKRAWCITQALRAIKKVADL